jgi:hypothetical protein
VHEVRSRKLATDTAKPLKAGGVRNAPAWIDRFMAGLLPTPRRHPSTRRAYRLLGRQLEGERQAALSVLLTAADDVKELRDHLVGRG